MRRREWDHEYDASLDQRVDEYVEKDQERRAWLREAEARLNSRDWRDLYTERWSQRFRIEKAVDGVLTMIRRDG